MSEYSVGPGTQVTLHFSLALESGEVIDSNFDAKPASFDFGDGKLLPGFEKVLVGLKAKQKASFTLPPEEAFGLTKEENIKQLERSSFSSEHKLEKGLVMNFADASGGELPAVVTDFNEQKVTVDFNHPLAGRAIVFTVEIFDVIAQSLKDNNAH